MQQFSMRGEHPELQELVAEASRALARLDADRLDELALSCQALNRELPTKSRTRYLELARQAHEATGDMATFSRVLEATRANLNVMKRLRELREKRIEYSARELPAPAGTEGNHGDN